MRRDVIAKITASNPDGQKARESLGTALHTLQDFYAHSNWVEVEREKKSGEISINNDLGRIVMPDPSKDAVFCPFDSGSLNGHGLTNLTSGYFYPICSKCYVVGKEFKCDPECVKKNLPIGKCYHGIGYCHGINKDYPDRGDDYGFAHILSRKATSDYLKQILDASGVAGNPRQSKLSWGAMAPLV